jgi:hypothetical protein
LNDPRDRVADARAIALVGIEYPECKPMRVRKMPATSRDVFLRQIDVPEDGVCDRFVGPLGAHEFFDDGRRQRETTHKGSVQGGRIRIGAEGSGLIGASFIEQTGEPN